MAKRILVTLLIELHEDHPVFLNGGSATEMLRHWNWESYIGSANHLLPALHAKTRCVALSDTFELAELLNLVED